MVDEKQDWYSPKQLFEMICELKEALQETTTVVKKYNSLRQELGDMGVEQRIQAKEIIVIQAEEIKTRAIAEARADTKATTIDYLLKVWPILLQTIIFIFTWFVIKSA